MSRRRRRGKAVDLGGIRQYKMWECRVMKLLVCPPDPCIGVPLYPAPVYFPRSDFLETLAEGYWPDGCEVEIALKYRGSKTRWYVTGCYLLEIGSDRVAISKFSNNKYATLRLIECGGLTVNEDFAHKSLAL